MNTVDFSETIAASDLKVGRSRHLITYMKICEYCRFGNVRENLILANIREFVASRIQSSR